MKVLRLLLASVVMLLCFGVSNTAIAQITVGSGTATSSNSPITSCYGYSYSEQIYLQSEIGASGMITSVSFYVNSVPTTNDESDNWTVYLGHTTKADFASTTDWETATGMTQAFSGTVTYPAAGNWMTITLTTPFMYNNTDNLVIGVHEDVPGWDCTINWNMTPTASNQVIYYRNDSNDPDPLAPPTATGTSANRANVILGGIQQACPTPSGLGIANLTTTSVDLAWTENGTATTWNVEYGAAGFTQGSGTTVSTTTNPHALSSLTANTAYEYYVQADCGGTNGTSTWAGPFSFSTLCSTFSTFPFVEDFESGSATLNCWSVINNNGDADEWTVQTSATYANSGSQSYEINTDFNSGANDDYLVSPGIVLTGNERIKYNYRARSSGEPNDYEVLLSTTGTAPADFTNVLLVDTASSTTYAETILDLSAYTGTVYIAFHIPNGGLDGWRLYIDDVTVEAIPQCLVPTGLTVSNVTTTSLDIAWTSASGLSNIEYGVSGFTPGTGTTLTGVTSPQSISSLSAGTFYDFYVTDDCGVNGTSVAALGTFNTSLQGAVGVTCTTTGANSFSLFTENFENNNAGWTGDVGSGNGNWEIPDGATSTNTGADDGYLGGNYMNYEASSTSTNQGSIVSPPIDLSGSVDDAELSFWMHAYGASMGTLEVGVGNSPTGPFTTEFTWSGQLQTSGADPWENIGINLSAYIGQTIYIQFTQIDDVNNLGSGFDGDMSIDLVEVSACLSCIPVSSLTTSNVTPTSADLAWTENDTGTVWSIEYGVAGFTQGNGTVISANSNPYTLGNLMDNTTYEFYVQASCGGGWIGPVSFTTLCLPATAPYMENFDGLALTTPYTALPGCWDAQTGPDFWDVTNDVINNSHTYLPNIGDHTTGTGNYMWIDASGDITANEMVTGLVDMSGLTTPYAGFWFASENTNNTVNHTIALDAWDGNAWVNMASEKGNFTGWVRVGDVVPASIPSTTKFRIYAIADTGTTSSTYFYNDLGVDDFFVMEQPLTAFANLTPADGTVLTVAGPAQNTVDITWESAQASNTTYEWLADAPGGDFSSALAVIPSNNMGMDPMLTLNIQQIDDLLASLGVAIGDTANIIWTAAAYSGMDTLLATTPFNLSLVRLGVSTPLFVNAPQNNGGTTGLRAPNGSASHTFMRAATVVLPTEFANAGIAANTTIRNFGFNINGTIPAGAVTGIFKLYLQNTTDVTYGKGTAWTGITPGMTEVFNDTITINGGGTAWDVVLDTLFAYAGNSVYVAYDWELVANPLGTAISYLANTELAGGLVSASSTTAPPATLAGSAFRPEFAWGIDRDADDLEVVALYALGKNPLGYSQAEQVQAIVRNNGYLPADKTVSLNITGANPFSTTENVTLAPGAETTVTFAAYSPTMAGFNDMVVDVPADDNTINDSQTWVQETTTNTFAYADSVLTGLGGVGYNTGSGLLLTRYFVDGPASVNSVNIHISDAAAVTGNTVYAVLIDTSGNIVSQSANYTVVAGDLGTWKTFTLNTTVNFDTEDIYVGLAQTANAVTGYFPVSFQSEDPTRPAAYYTAALTPAGLSTVNGFRLLIEAVVGPACLGSAASTITNANCFGEASGSIAVTVAGGTAPYTYAWSDGQTTATATGLTANVYDVTITDANGCILNTTETVGQPSAIVLATASVSDTMNLPNIGQASVTATGGTAPYTYAWSDGQTTATATGLDSGTYGVTVTDGNGCTDTSSVFVDIHVSTNAIEYLTDLSITPNPTRGNTIINLELSQSADVAVSIYTVTGVLVEDFGKENTSSQTHQVDLSTYADGMYFVRIVVDNQVITRKLMVTK